MPVASTPIINVRPRDSVREAVLARETGLQPLTAGLLLARGYETAEAIHAFLNPTLDDLYDPELLPGYREAADILLDAIKNKRKIYLHGDYDVDGVTSAAIFKRFFDSMGADVHVHVPHRTKEGYGVHDSAVDRAVEFGAEVFLTCDCGVAAVETVAAVRELGMKVVITDHHEPGAILPNAHAIVNPHLATSKYPFDNICGAAVVFKLCAGLTRELGHPVAGFYRAFLDLAALGTVADVMPLIDENRILAKFGLIELARSKKAGIEALRQFVQPNRDRALVAKDIGFGFGPRLNAAGRLEDAAQSLALLLTKDKDEAKRLANYLDDVNSKRKEAQKLGVQMAIEQVYERGEEGRNAIVVYNPEWHSGIVGLIAGRLVEEFYRPAFALTGHNGRVKGSARSIPGFNLFLAIQDLRESTGVGGGGHAGAAGVNMEESEWENFAIQLHEYVGRTMSAEQLIRKLECDAEATLAEMNFALIEELAMMGPFGEANPEPRCLFRNLEVASSRRMGADAQHVKLMVTDGNSPRFEVVKFNYGTDVPAPEGRINLVAHPEINEYQGRRSIQLVMSAWLPA